MGLKRTHGGHKTHLSIPPKKPRQLLICTSNLYSASTTERQVFLATWKDIPNENELQYQIKECHLNAGEIIYYLFT